MEHQINPEEVTRYTSYATFPADKIQLLNTATSHNATGDVLAVLKDLPEKEYADETDLVNEIEKMM